LRARAWLFIFLSRVRAAMAHNGWRLLLSLAEIAAGAAARRGAVRRGDAESGESKKPPHQGTLCQLLSREVLTEKDSTASPPLPAIHRLRFSLPATARTAPECCGGQGGMLHVRVKAPQAPGQELRLNPYSAHVVEGNATFDVVVKVYPGGPPTSPGVSAYLGALAVGEYAHVPEIRALDWRRDSKRVGMVCFGVGITECLGPAAVLLRAGAEVRMLYANRHAGQIIMREDLIALVSAYPGRFRLRHCLSQPAELPPSWNWEKPGERATRGRVDHKVLRTEFGGAWSDGHPVQHFLMIGTTAMEQEVLGMIGRAGLADFSRIRGHPEFLLMKGPHGHNSDWTPLSPSEHALATSANSRVEL